MIYKIMEIGEILLNFEEALKKAHIYVMQYGRVTIVIER